MQIKLDKCVKGVYLLQDKELNNIESEGERMEEESLNKKVANFRFNKRKYEIDHLTDAQIDNFKEYDIFDVTDNKTGEYVGHITSEDDDHISLVEQAKREINL